MRIVKFDKLKSDQVALELLNLSYREGARGPAETDCVGLAIIYMEKFGIKIPKEIGIDEWRKYESGGVLPKLFRKLQPEEPLETGDVLTFFRGAYRVSSAIDTLGLYLGDGQRFIHAGLNFDPVSMQMSLMPRFGVYVQSLVEEHWKSRVYGVYRAKAEDGGK